MQHFEQMLEQFNEDKQNHPLELYLLQHHNQLFEDYEIEIVRNHFDSYCVYVILSNNHPDVGKDYEEIDIDVHGGLTYANQSQ